jgi:hypothetical protein
MVWNNLSIELVSNNEIINTGFATNEGLVTLTPLEIQETLEIIFYEIENPSLKKGIPSQPLWDSFYIKLCDDNVVVNFVLIEKQIMEYDMMINDYTRPEYLKFQYDNLI